MKDRKHQQFYSCFSKDSSSSILFLKSCNEQGVIRNYGRRGTTYSPQAILNCFKKLSCHKKFSIREEEVSSKKDQDCYEQLQENECQLISKYLPTYSEILFHLGGGHDHIYPLLLAHKDQPIHVINIDAHTDTRNDDHFHSGTPFRQFAQVAKNKFRLTQLGIHPFANPKSSFEKMPSEMICFSTEDLNSTPLEQLIEIKSNELTILSLDCDALCSQIMEAVSAVNHQGLSLEKVQEIFYFYRANISGKKIVGIYEYNPIYDNLSQKGARSICALISNFIENHQE